jgi:GDP-L-fucose synthase
MPTNLYGPFDNFDPETGHVLPTLIWKFHQAKATRADHVTLWGDGSALREFLHVDDLARACLTVLSHYNEGSPINVGFGSDVSIKALADQISKVVGFEGKIVWDTDKPNGTPRKLLDSTRISKLGWKPEKDLETGLQDTYEWFLANTWANLS